MKIPGFKWMASPVYAGDADRTDAARTLNRFLLALLFVGLLVAIGLLMAGILSGVVRIASLSVAAVVVLALLAGLRFGHVRAVGYATLGLLWLAYTFLMVLTGGVQAPSIVGYALVLAIASFVGDRRWLIALTILSGGVGALIEAVQPLTLVGGLAVRPSPIVAVAVSVAGLLATGFFLHAIVTRVSAAWLLARRTTAALQLANTELAAGRQELAEQKARLERRNAHLAATMVVAQEALEAMGDVDRLLSRVVHLVTERFGYYHTGIFWLDPTGEWVVLQAASSAGGERMLARGHRLRVGEGIVGYVAQQGAPRAALDVDKDVFFSVNPDLPETRSEMAVPLRSQGQVMGVLDVQSIEPRAFTSEDVSVLQALADQVSLAVTNARLLVEARQRLEMVQRTYGEMAEAAWQQLFQQESGVGFLSSERGASPIDGPWHDAMAQAMQTAQPVEAGDGTVAVPVMAAGQVVAVVEVHLPDAHGAWTSERREMLETLSAQLSQVLERARLYRDAQKTAMREQLLREISDEMGRAGDITSLMRITTEALNRRLGGSRIYVRLNPADRVSADGSSDGGDTRR